MFINDIYILKASDPFEIEAREEADVNLWLKKVPPCYRTLLTGRVLFKNTPIKNATVLVLNKHNKPLFHTVTNEKGVYEFRNLLKPGEYNVIAKAFGYKTSRTKSIKIKANRVEKLSFTLKKSHVFENGVVYGRIFEAVSRKPIENANISLISLPDGCMAFYKTRSNHCGQYFIYDILPGKYRMVIKKQGYEVSNVKEITISKHDCIELNIDLIRKARE